MLDAAEKAAAQTQRRRDLADFSPKDLSQVAEFMEEGQSGAPNPLRRLAAELAEKGRQRRALATTESVEVEEDDDESLGDPDEEPNFGVDGDDEDMLDEDEEMAFANGGGEEDDDEDEEEDEDAVAAPKKSFKPSFGDEEEQSGDLVQDFELSDEDDDDNDAPEDIMGRVEQQPKKVKGGKGKGADGKQQQGKNDKRKGGGGGGGSSSKSVRKSPVEKASSGFSKRSSKSGPGKGKPGSKGKPRK